MVAEEFGLQLPLVMSSLCHASIQAGAVPRGPMAARGPVRHAWPRWVRGHAGCWLPRAQVGLGGLPACLGLARSCSAFSASGAMEDLWEN